jgi:NodT family efflux transporter outer membrane factor (OMF) lipoprotein
VVEDWWTLYRDPTLDQLVNQALAANTDLRIAAANLARAKAVLGESRSGLYLPSTQVTASATQGRSAAANAAASAANTKAHATANDTAGFTASYEVDLFGRLRRGVEASKADAQAAAAALDYARVAVAADTARAYVEACTYGEAVAAARASRDIARQTDEITRSRRKLGAASEFDAARASALARQAEAAVPALEAQRQAVLFSLSVLTGQPPESINASAARCTRAPVLARPAPIGNGAALLRRRPDIRAAERQLAADTARIGVATAQLFPIITLGGQLSSAGVTPDKAFAYAGSTFSVGPAVSWTVPNIAVARARIGQSSAQARASLARLDGVVLTALKDVETALSNLDAERQRNVALGAARDQFKLAAGLAQSRFDQGSASFLDLLDAQRSLQSAEADLAASDVRRGDAEIALFRALGGGWKAAPAVVDPSVSR